MPLSAVKGRPLSLPPKKQTGLTLMKKLLLAASNSSIRLVEPFFERIWSFQPLAAPAHGGEMPVLERFARVLFIVLLLIGLPIALNRSIQNDGGVDFPHFYQSGKYVLEHGARDPASVLGRYLPSADIPFAIFAWMPLSMAAGVWYLFNCWTWFGLLGTTSRYLLPDADSATLRTAPLGAGLLLMPLAIDGFCVGAFHVLMVWLMVAGLSRVSRGRCWSGGFLLGTAAWLKLLPALGIGYLLLKRKWLPAAIAMASVVILDVVLTVVAYGPKGAWQEHVTWWHQGASGTMMRQLTSPKPVDEDRITNQSVAVTLRRLLTYLGSEPGSARNQVGLANLSGEQLKVAYLLAMGLLAVPLLYFCRRPARGLSLAQWSAEIAMISLATLWFSPVVWSYHPTAALPAMAVVLSRGEQHPRLVWMMTIAWLAALALLACPVARACGDLLWVSLLLGAVLILITPRAAAQPCSDCCPSEK
jgi:hypothetical protein